MTKKPLNLNGTVLQRFIFLPCRVHSEGRSLSGRLSLTQGSCDPGSFHLMVLPQEGPM